MSGTRRTGITLKDVAADTFITEFANHLKKGGKLKLPVYHDLVKTAFYKELPPYSADWYYTRAAAIIRRVYCRYVDDILFFHYLFPLIVLYFFFIYCIYIINGRSRYIF